MRTFNILIVATIFALLAAVAIAEPLPATKAERVGMSTERLERITEMTQKYVDEGKMAGVITMVARNGKLVHFEAVGNKGAYDPRPLEKDDLFRIYSMTKPITVTAAMQLYEQGEFHLNDPVHKFIPEFKDLKVLNENGVQVPVKNHMTMQQLLTHTTGLSSGGDVKGSLVDKLYREAKLYGHENLDAFIKTVAKLPLKFEPGSQWHYSIAVDVTGAVIERLSGKSLDVYLKENIFDPLGMKDTFFEVPKDKITRFLPNHSWDAKNNKLVAFEVPEWTEKNHAMANYAKVTQYSGGGGLVSTAMDYMKFAEMMRNGGQLDGTRILGEKTVKYMAKNHLTASITGGGTGEAPLRELYKGHGFGLGFGIVTDTVVSGVMLSEGVFHWGGAAGTVFWIDPVENLAVVGMTQLMDAPLSFPYDLIVAVNQAITKSYE